MILFTLILGVYAITTILTDADGPLGIFYRLRQKKYLSVLLCFMCTSLWAAAYLSLLVSHNLAEWFLYTIASAGGAIAIDKTVNGL